MDQLIPILQAHNLGCLIGSRWLWRGVSFDVIAGDRLGVIGPSGIGKSLLMRSLIGLEPLAEGRVVFQGRSLKDWNIPLFRQRCLYLSQSPGLIEGTVEENLRLVFKLKACRPREFKVDVALAFFRALGRGDAFLGQSVGRLSGGERQLLNLVRGLMIEPTVLLLDEPSSALDMETTAQVEQLLQEWLSGANGRAYLWISHSPDQIQRVTDAHINLSDFAL